MSGWDKFLGLIGLKVEPEDDERYGGDYDRYYEGNSEETGDEMMNYPDDDYPSANERSYKKNTGKISGIPDDSRVRLLIYRPVSYEDTQSIIDNLKEKKPLVVNLDELDTDVAQRILDFISGAVYALSGSIKKGGRNIFIVAPYNVEVATNMQDEISGDDFEYNYFDRE